MLKKCVNKVRCSLTARIFLITALILCSACAVTYLFIVWATPFTYQSIATDGLDEKIDILISRLADVALEDSAPLFDGFVMETGASVMLKDEAGNTIELPTSLDWGIVSDDGSGLSQGTAYTQVTITEAEDLVQTAVDSGVTVAAPYPWLAPFLSTAFTNSDWNQPFLFKDGEQLYRLVVVASITAVNQAVEAMGKIFPYLMIVVLMISLLGALIYSRYITRPIVRLSSISEKMAKLDFSWVCTQRRRDEIGVLGQNLDELSRQLSAALGELKTANAALEADIAQERELERQRTTFFAAASHELKTPITILKGQLAGMLAGVDIYHDRDKYLARSLAVTGRMEHLVQEMLTISRMEGKDAMTQMKRVNLSQLVQAKQSQVEELALQRWQPIQAYIAPDVTVQGDEALLGRAITNLLTNAITYSPEGQRVLICLSRGERGPVLTVENEGIQIPEEALPHVFEAFYRVEASRNRQSGGSGLGLYLVKLILDQHGADCTLTNTHTGVRATAVFPGTV